MKKFLAKPTLNLYIKSFVKVTNINNSNYDHNFMVELLKKYEKVEYKGVKFPDKEIFFCYNKIIKK